MDTSHSDKIKVLKNITKRTNGHVLISTKKNKNMNFSVDYVTETGLYRKAQEGIQDGVREIAISSIIEIKEITGEILYPKG
jgi:hypothetical protein